MMQDTCPAAAPCAAHRSRRAATGGYVTVGTLILASVSAVALVLLSGCHSAPASSAGSNAFAPSAGDKAVEARLRQRDTMPPLQPFDEGFVPQPADE
jgi:hypothetical protein